ncbi:MAG: RagB/SusD family nutrient uptake outer membrane protein [Prevotella sp.]|nr:RagB/SusD family nutrient uptake outer membrane protein [Prevotella sp.]
MKKIICVFATVLLMLSGGACTDLLDTAPYNQLASGNMWTSESLVEQGVAGVYASLRDMGITSGSLVGASLRLGNYGYEALGMSGQTRLGANNIFRASVAPSNSLFSDTWKMTYTGVHRANDAIANIPKAPVSDELKGMRIAECKFLRAFFYFRLNQLFGGNGRGVPLYLEPVSPEDCVLGQTPEAEVWEQIIKDLTEAIDDPYFPNNYIGKKDGRASKGAAYALRGKAYLYTGQYKKACDDFEQVAGNGYKLFPDFKQLFKEANENCEEMIFSLQFIENSTGGAGVYGSAQQKYVAPFIGGSKDSRGCWTDLQATPDVADLYEVIVDDNTVKPFNWDDYIPGYNNLAPAAREVYFLRDKKKNGADIHGDISVVVNSRLNNAALASVKSEYLEEGNEARIRRAYDKRDPRLELSMITPYSRYLGVNSNSTAEAWYVSRWPSTGGGTATSGKYYADQPSSIASLVPGMESDCVANAPAQFYYIHRKFIGEGLEFAFRENNPIDDPLIRYADVLLMWAEALVELGGSNLQEAMAKVKLVRDRVGIPTMASSFADQNTARNYVRDERRREFVNEGLNFFDEMRWRTLKETKYDKAPYSKKVWGAQAESGSEHVWPGDHYYVWPVPKSETELNPNLTRTPGWAY